MNTYKQFIQIIASIILVVTISACAKNPDPTLTFDESKLAPFSIEFDNIVGERTFALDNVNNQYTNAKGEKFSISSLQYFISNIKLATANGETYTVNQDSSYFLINGADRSTRFTKTRVPVGDYTKLTFTIGVDSVRSTMDISKRTGVLDPASGHDGMYWGWNSGYIFFKLEGNSPSISDDVNGDPTGNKKFRYHIGGFGGYSSPTINNVKTVTIDLTTAGIAKVRPDRQSNVHLFVDIMKVFNGSNSFSIAQHPSVMFSQFSTGVAQNLTEMFRHDHTEN